MLLASDDESHEEKILLLLAEEQGIDEAAGAIMDHEITRARRVTTPL